MPHNEAGELASGRPVASDDLQPGDILVFADTYRRGLSHAGIYVGDGRFVHAVDESHGVMISNLWDGYWGPRLVGATRPSKSGRQAAHCSRRRRPNVSPRSDSGSRPGHLDGKLFRPPRRCNRTPSGEVLNQHDKPLRPGTSKQACPGPD